MPKSGFAYSPESLSLMLLLLCSKKSTCLDVSCSGDEADEDNLIERELGDATKKERERAWQDHEKSLLILIDSSAGLNKSACVEENCSSQRSFVRELDVARAAWINTTEENFSSQNCFSYSFMKVEED